MNTYGSAGPWWVALGLVVFLIALAFRFQLRELACSAGLQARCRSLLADAVGRDAASDDDDGEGDD